MKALILAAGEGTRLRPLTLDRPKPMLPIGGRPLLEHIVAWLRHHGVTRIAINLHHRPHVVMDHFGSGSAFGVEITYSVEDEILGTAGGAKRLSAFLDETFVLAYGDVLTDLALGTLLDFHRSRPKTPHLSICLYRVPNPWDCGIVRLDEQDRVLEFVEKPKRHEVFSDLASSGVLVVDPELLRYIPDGCFFDFGLVEEDGAAIVGPKQEESNSLAALALDEVGEAASAFGAAHFAADRFGRSTGRASGTRCLAIGAAADFGGAGAST